MEDRERQADPVRLYTERVNGYLRFVRLVRYPQGIRSHFFRSPLLRSGLRVLDAGCGTGIVTFALLDALSRRGFEPGPQHAFDLTPAMLDRFAASLRERAAADVRLRRADVLDLDTLPSSWSDYDLIVSASMLEYLPRHRLAAALAGLRRRLHAGGALVFFISRRSLLTRPLIGRWWDANLYTAAELEEACRQSGLSNVRFRRFPLRYRYLDLWGYIVEAGA